MGALCVSLGANLVDANVRLLVAMIALILAGNFVRGLKVNGYVGALIGAVAIAAVTSLVDLLGGRLVAA